MPTYANQCGKLSAAASLVLVTLIISQTDYALAQKATSKSSPKAQESSKKADAPTDASTEPKDSGAEQPDAPKKSESESAKTAQSTETPLPKKSEVLVKA